MKLHYQLSEQDYIDFNLYYFNHSPTMKKSVLKSRILGPILYLALPFVLKNISSIPFYFTFSFFGITAVLWFLFYPTVLKKSFVSKIKKTLKEKDNHFLGNKSLELQEHSIITEGDYEQVQTAYSSIASVEEFDGAVYLFNSALSAIIISSNAFSSSAHREEFLSLLREKVAQAEPALSKEDITSASAKRGMMKKLEEMDKL